jgi:uncharacterized membrane protein required for colicin V production
MGIQWLDLTLTVVLLLTVIIEWRRGFGRAIFDFAGILIAFVVAKLYYVSLTGWIHPFHAPENNEAFSFLTIIFLGSGFLLLIADLIYNSLLLSTDVFERCLGGICGFAIGLAVVHALAFGIWLSNGKNADRAGLFNHSIIAKEYLTFDSYHRTMIWLTQLGQEKPRESASL